MGRKVGTNAARSNYVEVKDSPVISSPSDGVPRWEYPSIQFEMEGKPDGSSCGLEYCRRKTGEPRDGLKANRRTRRNLWAKAGKLSYPQPLLSANGQHCWKELAGCPYAELGKRSVQAGS